MCHLSAKIVIKDGRKGNYLCSLFAEVLKMSPFKTFEEKKDLACLKERVIHFDLMLHIHTYF